MGGQRPGPYDRPMMGGPRGGFFGPGPGRGGALMDTMRSGGGYGGGEQFCISACRNIWWLQECGWLVRKTVDHRDDNHAEVYGLVLVSV